MCVCACVRACVRVCVFIINIKKSEIAILLFAKNRLSVNNLFKICTYFGQISLAYNMILKKKIRVNQSVNMATDYCHCGLFVYHLNLLFINFNILYFSVNIFL